ncbi:hypothetical protein E2562_022722 [Oryza meyeriana var. granulata]|uniref:Uncharacterized protein n=1 Tax=Oryza meyeriana var. granulata TaxID=110450 RepID=A0A6G1DZ45_9ORYZ|nr:hypothetical protein E2562_022722 [Oryza meyeriana var. granulata]
MVLEGWSERRILERLIVERIVEAITVALRHRRALPGGDEALTACYWWTQIDLVLINVARESFYTGG